MSGNVGVARVNITIPINVLSETKEVLKKPMTFSGLVSDLVADWVKQRKRDKAFEALRGTWVESGGPDFKNLAEYNRWKAKIWGPTTKRIIKKSSGLSS